MQPVEEPAVLCRSFVSVLQECRHKKDAGAAKRLHSYMRDHNLVSHTVLCNYLIPMLVDCASLSDVEDALNCIPPPNLNEHSWTSLIACFTNYGDPYHALNLYTQMQQENSIRPSKFTYVAAILACSRVEDIERGHILHAETTKHGLDQEAYVGSSLVDMYTKCGSLHEAYLVFDMLPIRDEVSWTALIAGYADYGFGQEVLVCCEQMIMEGLCVDASCFVCSLKACAMIGSLETGWGLHADLTKRGMDGELYVGNALVDMYTKCESLAEAVVVFDMLPTRSVVLWNTIIAGYVENGMATKATHCFLSMHLEGILPDSVTYFCSLKGCVVSEAVESAFQIHAEVTWRGWDAESELANMLVEIYAKCAFIEEAHQILFKLSMQETFLWNMLLLECVTQGFNEDLFKYFHDMQLKGVFSNETTFTCILKACGTTGSFEMGHKIHSCIAKRGWDVQMQIMSTLMDMYRECNLVVEAHALFNRFPVEDRILLNTHLLALSDEVLSVEALKYRREIQYKDTFPNLVILVNALRACSTVRDLQMGQEIHTILTKRGEEMGLYAGSTLVDMYGKCSLLAECCQVFDMLPFQSSVSWNAFISGYAENRPTEEVLNCFEKMELEGVAPDAVTFLCGLKAASLDIGKLMYTQSVKRGFDIDLIVGSAFVDMYSKYGLLAEARRVLDCLPLQNTVSWNSLIAGYAECGLSEQVLNCFRDMQVKNVPMDSVTFLSSLKACATVRSLKLGQILHIELVIRGLESNIHIASSLVDMYSKCNSVDGHHVFDMFSARNQVLWNVLIGGFVENGILEAALASFRKMQQDVAINEVTLVNILKACGSSKDYGTGYEMHTNATKIGYDRENAVGNILVGMYNNCSMLAEAGSVFKKLLNRNRISWNIMLSGYAERGFGAEVVNNYKRMQSEGVFGDAITFIFCLKGCGTIGALETGQEIHDDVKKAGLEGELSVSHALMDMYGKCGSVAEAYEVFDQLPSRDVVSWNTMLKVYGENSAGIMAVQCFEQMQKTVVKPDSITFTCILAACSHASLICMGERYFDTMRYCYRIEPTLDHYGCMADLFARSGDVHKAERFIAVIQCLPSITVLMSVLSACKSYGELEAGQRCFQVMVEMNHQDASAYLLMGEIYASAGRLSDSAKVEELRRSMGVKKKPGSAVIEVDKQLHKFVVGICPERNIFEILKLVNWRSREEGYVCTHSESSV